MDLFPLRLAPFHQFSRILVPSLCPKTSSPAFSLSQDMLGKWPILPMPLDIIICMPFCIQAIMASAGSYSSVPRRCHVRSYCDAVARTVRSDRMEPSETDPWRFSGNWRTEATRVNSPGPSGPARGGGAIPSTDFRRPIHDFTVTCRFRWGSPLHGGYGFYVWDPQHDEWRVCVLNPQRRSPSRGNESGVKR